MSLRNANTPYTTNQEGSFYSSSTFCSTMEYPTQTSHMNVTFLLSWAKEKRACLSSIKDLFGIEFYNVIINPSDEFPDNGIYIPFI